MSRCLALFLLLLFPLTAEAGLFNVQSLTLPNGLQVVVVENHRAPVVAHMLWIKAGAADDPYGKSGLAHYLEHLMFKGTKKFPQGQYSARIARAGGTENAFTTADYTAFHATVAKDKLPLIMELESDRLANLIITPEAAKPELAVILDERRQRIDNDPYSPFTLRLETLLHPRHPYGTPVIGWQGEMETFTAQDALNFYRRWYSPSN
ncbi:MAG TPA: pitrilysin family protein, partial [Alphaproteobacteria bacterium]|nr:pitrilysin family protein [Alphaproteobacteria bacterium]